MDDGKSFIVALAELIDQHWPRRMEQEKESTPKRSWARSIGRHLVPNVGTLLLVAVLIATQQVWAGPLLGTTNVPGPSATTVNYQGRLADDAGTPLSGTYGMTFALYDAPTDGNLVWGPESHSAIPVSDGLFSVGLGSQTSGGIPTTTWNGDVYLEVTVSGETLEPRELIRSVPIAGMALTVPDGAVTSRMTSLTTGRVYASAVQDLSTEYQEIPGMTLTLTPETDQTYLVYVTADFRVISGLAQAKLSIDGVLHPSEIIFESINGQGRGTVSQTFLVDLPAGTHTLVLQARTNSTSFARVYNVHTSMTYFAVSQ